MSTTIQHTIPTGETIDFEVAVDSERARDGAVRATITYPAGIDLSRWRSAEAYPTTAIEAAVASVAGVPALRFSHCNDTGVDAGAWEVWHLREPKA